jgi:hypothetical protein
MENQVMAKAKKTKSKKPAKKAAKRKPVKKAAKPTTGLSLLNLKVSKADRAALNAQAKRYAAGNLSAWLRFAGVTFKPKKSQLSARV